MANYARTTREQLLSNSRWFHELMRFQQRYSFQRRPIHAATNTKSMENRRIQSLEKGKDTKASHSSLHDIKRKNRNANNNKMSMLRKPMPDSWFVNTRVFEEESTDELPAMLVNFALSIHRSCAPSRKQALEGRFS